ncbi:hypothetical protein ACFE04_008768 [Oxalis oulophora]
MGKKKQQSSKSQTEDLISSLEDFTSKENWDKFYTSRGTGDSFEWYGEWTQLRNSLITVLKQVPSISDESPASPQILVPGCGNSRLSEHLYDAGFHAITNIDFSKVVVSDMLRRNVRDRPIMKWRIMDMTKMQFEDETFDVVVDKGGLDALMEPELGPALGNQYLLEVKRVLKSGGKFVCLTLAESHVVALLFSKFRFGWKMSVHDIPQQKSNKPGLQTFMVVAEKENSTVLNQITSSFEHLSLSSSGNQVTGLHAAFENENHFRREFSNSSDIQYSLEDIKLGVKGDLTKLQPGQRFQLTLCGQRDSIYSYKAVLLDSQEDSGPFSYHCGVFIVPKTRAHEWLFSSEEGQWMVVESSKAARLIMKDLSPLVQQLAPENDDSGAQIPFMMASDGIKHRSIIQEVTSSLTGPIIVEDVIYEDVDDTVSKLLPSKDLIFRRLVFQRAENLVQSEALLTTEGSSHKTTETVKKKSSSSSKTKRKGAQSQNDELKNQLNVYHGYLASSYHTGIISGFMLISSYLESMASSGKMVQAAVIGLGAGLLPMFLHGCMPFLHIVAVELDSVMLNLAKDHFGFVEGSRMEVQIADGIQFVKQGRNSLTTGSNSTKFDILIIDVDSSDSSSGMTCPAADFVEQSFLQTALDSLSEQGLFVVNLVTRSAAIKDSIVSRMKEGSLPGCIVLFLLKNVLSECLMYSYEFQEVFCHLFCLQLEEDVNLVLFGLRSKPCSTEDDFPEAAVQLQKLLKLKHPEISQSIVDSSKKIRLLK